MSVTMLIHIEDGATLNILVNDQGVILVICPDCKKVWIGNLTAIDSSIEYKGTGMISAITHDVAEIIRSMMNSNPRLLDQAGLTPDMISKLGL